MAKKIVDISGNVTVRTGDVPTPKIEEIGSYETVRYGTVYRYRVTIPEDWGIVVEGRDYDREFGYVWVFSLYKGDDNRYYYISHFSGGADEVDRIVVLEIEKEEKEELRKCLSKIFNCPIYDIFDTDELLRLLIDLVK